MRFATAFLLAALLAISVYRAVNGRFTLNRSEPMVSPAPAAVAGKPSRRLMFVVLDGARADAIPAVPSVLGLLAHGAVAQLEADLPTISAAQYVSLLTGATPQTSGIRGNDGLVAEKLESVADVVRRAGGRAAAYSDCVDWWWELFPSAFDATAGPKGLPAALELAAQPYDFLLVHFCAFDDAGHAFGAADPAYRLGAALQVEAKLAALRRVWGDAGPVLVTSDHGHRDSGGHGGDEPEVTGTFVVLGGDGVAHDGRAKGRAIDVAATAAALMGLQAPSGSEGRTLTALLELAPEERARIESADAARSAALAAEAEQRRAQLEVQEDFWRALRAGSAGAILLLVAALARRQRRAAAIGLFAGLAALALGCAGYRLLVGAVSPSSAKVFGDLVKWTFVLGLASGAVIVLPLARLRRGREHALLAAAAGASPLVVWMYAMYGVWAPRVSITTAWAIALPSLAWSGWAGVLLMLLFATVAGLRRPVT